MQGRKHAEIVYYLSQILTGHEYFRSYLKRLESPSHQSALYCPGAADDVSHAFSVCDRSLQGSIKQKISPYKIVEVMLRGGHLELCGTCLLYTSRCV